MSYWGNRKPDFGLRCGIDWGHPLARGLVGCWLFNEGAGNPCDIITQTIAGVHGTRPLWTATPSGVGTTSNSAIGAWLTGDTYLPTLSRFTVDVIGTGRQNAQTYQAVAWKGQANVYAEWNAYMLMQDNNKATIRYQITDGSARLNKTGTLEFFNQKMHHVLMRYEPGGLRGYIDGVQDITDTTTLVPYTGQNYTGFGGSQSRASENVITAYRVWNRAFSAAEVAWLYSEPYAFIQAPEMPIFYSIPAGGSFNPAWARQHNIFLGGGIP